MAHHHTHSTPSGIRLIITIILNFVITIAEIIGGIVSGSLSLISDALHNFSDGISVIISYIAIRLQQRENSYRHTFGLKRAEILAAVFNSAVLIVISLYLFYEAAIRFKDPQVIKGQLMFIVASIGLIANVIGTLLLKKDSGGSLNIRSAYLHLLTDVFSSLAVILGSLSIIFWDLYWIDPILTILIGLYILKESYEIITEALHVLMEGTPKSIDLEKIKKRVEKIDEVKNIHHIHVWSVGERDIHLEAHLNVADMLISDGYQIIHKVETILHEKFHIHHVTLQLECDQCENVGLIKGKNKKDSI